ncbi:hypothetical protein BT93_I1622 [Corymbia citriodora subsp. variegata]|nr:hypothetical protein BT93_I1622 [Corymbia citriodora subsp. variegata]
MLLSAHIINSLLTNIMLNFEYGSLAMFPLLATCGKRSYGEPTEVCQAERRPSYKSCSQSLLEGKF